MRNLIFVLLITPLFWGCQQATDHNGKTLEEVEVQDPNSPSSIIRSPVTAEGIKDTVNVAKMTFTETRYEFGEVFEGDFVKYNFQFTNTGKVPLLIQDCRSTCGCTVPVWPKEPIPPGGAGEIKVVFSTDGKVGTQEKPVMITANTFPGLTTVYISGKVKAKG